MAKTKKSLIWQYKTYLFAIPLFIIAFFLGAQWQKNASLESSIISQTPPVTNSPTQKVLQEAVNQEDVVVQDQTKPSPLVTKAAINGARLSEIKYSIPDSWTASIENDQLMLAPKTNGGFLSVKVYEYSGSMGRRAYYCQITKYCVDGVTTYEETKIGNITGYMPRGLDNSGGGSEYFGAKGNKFYIISGYNPPSPNDYSSNVTQVLDSLQF